MNSTILNSDSNVFMPEEPLEKSGLALDEQPSLSLADIQDSSRIKDTNQSQDSQNTRTSTPPLNQSPEIPKRSTNDDVASSSSLSAPPSPINTHRPTSSKTSVEELPVTPLDAVDKSAPGQTDTEGTKEDKQSSPKVNREKDPTPVAAPSPIKPPTGARLPDNQVDAIMEINAELIRVYNEFHTQNQTQLLSAEFHQYYIRIQSNMHWLAQRSDQFAAQIPQSQRIHLPILSAPPVVPFTPCDRLQAVYATLPSLFERESTREQKKRQHRQLMLSSTSTSMAGLASTSSPVNVNINGKRERPEDDHTSESGGQSPRKRIDTGESKLTPGPDSSPAHLHGSPVRAATSPMSGIARPSSSQSNHSSHAGSMPPPSLYPSTNASTPTSMSNVEGMNPQDRMRMMQQSRLRAMSTGSGGSGGSPMSMNSSTVSSSLAQQNQGLAQAITGYNQPISAAPPTNGYPQSGSVPPTMNRDGTINLPAMLQNTNRPPAGVYPSLVHMIQNPGSHQSVQTLMSKIPGWSGLRLEQQVQILWAFQSAQMRQSGLAQSGMMVSQQPPQQQPTQPNGGYANAAMGMRPPSASGQQPGQGQQHGSMQPPPPPNAAASMQLQNQIQQHQQRQLALLKQQQQAQQQAGMARQMNGMMGMSPAGGGGGAGMMGMGGNMMMGGHTRMPSNPSMGPPPVPLTASSPQSGYSTLSQGGYGMNPSGMSYGGMGQPSQQMGMQQQQQQQGMMMMTPSAMMQQAQAQAAKMAGGVPQDGTGTMDPSAGISWQDLTAS